MAGVTEIEAGTRREDCEDPEPQARVTAIAERTEKQTRAGREIVMADLGSLTKIIKRKSLGSGLRKRFGGRFACRFVILRINHQASSQPFAFTLGVQVGLLPQSKMDDTPLA